MQKISEWLMARFITVICLERREKTAEAIHQMKNYAYDHYTCAGRLADEKHGDLATPQLLWVCVPFGLFTPEDLVTCGSSPVYEGNNRPMQI